MDCDVLTAKLKAILTCVDLAVRLRDVEGYLLDIQAYTLMMLANEGPGTGVIVEIGSFMGRSACCLALGSKSAYREKVYAVDHFKGSPEHQKGAACESKALVETGSTFPQFLENIKRLDVEDYVRPIQAASREAVVGWDKPIRLLFIDGDHSYDVSREDFELWSPHVITGGVIAFHDIGDAPGVTRFYNELLSTSTEYHEVMGINGLNIVEKVLPDPT